MVQKKSKMNVILTAVKIRWVQNIVDNTENPKATQ